MEAMRSVALGVCLLDLQASASRFRRAGAGVQLVHPGHQAVLTTRLLRHDHGGLAELAESERRWQAGSSLLQEEEVASTQAGGGWILAARQLELLRQHQKVALAEVDGQEGSLLQVSSEDQEEGEAAPTALRLSSLSSEYLGPIGVGSVFSSPSCAAMAQNKGVTNSSMLQGCKVSFQSQVWVVFDTGSTNLWINSDACKKGSCSYNDRHRYDHTKSNSYKDAKMGTVSVKFGTGGMKGPMATDDFKIGPVNVHGQTFAMIEEQTGSVFETLPLEGIVGLAFPAMAAKGSTPFMENVIAQKALPSNEVSFYFSAKSPSANAMLWGGVDSKFYEGQIEYFNVAKPWYWGLHLKAFKIGQEDLLKTVAGDFSSSLAQVPRGGGGGARLEEKAWEGIIDTGTTHITAPGVLFNQIMKRIPEVRCKEMTAKSHPPMTFVFENAAGQDRELTLDNSQYMARDDEDEGFCSPSLMKLELHNKHKRSMLIGQSFMKCYFTVFDRRDGDPQNARVGFARAKQGDAVNEHLKSITAEQGAFADAHRESADAFAS